MADLDSLNTSIIACRKCPRLVEWRERVASEKRRAFRDWEYWGKPVPGFGDSAARLLIVGLAPGAHGSNRTGRNFTGDASGDFLFPALYRAGFASQPLATNREDGMQLKDAYIAAVCRCAPPDNKPLPGELLACRPYLLEELNLLQNLRGVVALGKIAFDAFLAAVRQAGWEIPALEFGHTRFYPLGESHPWLLGSYHPSRQNTQTGRLTVAMFDQVWQQARRALE